jgi:type II secretory pathway component PulF
MTTSPRLVDELSARAIELDRQCVPFTSGQEARDELQRRLGRVSKAINESDHLETRRQLVTLLAHGLRMARDLGIETEADAVRMDEAALDRHFPEGRP